MLLQQHKLQIGRLNKCGLACCNAKKTAAKAYSCKQYSRMFKAALEALYAIHLFPTGFFSGSVMPSLFLVMEPRPLDI